MTKLLKIMFLSFIVSFCSFKVNASQCLELGYNASHQTSQKIIDAFKSNDNVALAELMFAYIVNGPSQTYVANTKFDLLFSKEVKQQILDTEGTKEQCYPMGSNGAMVARGIIWIADADDKTEGFSPIKSINRSLKPIVNAPKTRNSYWTSDLGDLHSSCFSTLWMSYDNYELFAEQFNIYDLQRFKSFPGEFFGSEIDSLEPINQGWAKDKPQSLGFRTSDCIDSAANLVLQSDNSVIIEDCSTNTDCSQKSYKLHRVINQRICTKLTRNFHGTCKSSYLVSIREGEGAYYTHWAIYGLFKSEPDGEVILPLANFKNENAALEFIRGVELEVKHSSAQKLDDF